MKSKFNPIKIGFKIDKRKDKEVVYNLLKDGKIIAWMIYHDFMKPPYWLVYTVEHYPGGMEGHTLVFKGNIPNNSFAKQLIKNVL